MGCRLSVLIVVACLTHNMLALRTLFGRSAARSSIIRASSSLNVLSRRKVGLESSDPVVPGAPRERVVPVVVPKPASEPPVDVDAKAEAPGPSMTPAEFRKLHQITVKGDDSAAFEPWINFEDTPFAPSLKRVFSTAGYTSPTSIQACAWPIALGKRDVISVARTGSGKTCGFLLPALHRIMEEREADKFVAQKRYGATRGARKIPSVLVLAPTRELAVQIEAEAQKYSRAANAFIMSMYGGASKGMQVRPCPHTYPHTFLGLSTPLCCLPPTLLPCSLSLSLSLSCPTDPETPRRRRHCGGDTRALQRPSGDGRVEPLCCQISRAGRSRSHA